MRERDYLDNDVQTNIEQDRDLDHRLETSVDRATWAGAAAVAEREYKGQMAPYIRALIVRDLRQRYLIG